MCHSGTISNEKENRYHLADFFNAFWDIYAKDPKEYIQPEQYKAANAIRVCRTAALGVDVYACPQCGEITEVFHSCKNRFCPTCSWRDTVKWADRVKGEMMDVPHRHAIFTLPHKMNNLIKENGKHLLNVLLRTSADTLKDWIEHKYGLKIGVISVLHTYGEQKGLHYHVHMIVSWGGIDNVSGDLKAIEGDYVNFKFIKDKFRCKFEDSMVKLYDSGQLESGFKNRIEFMQFLNRINNKNWNIHLEAPMDIPALVIRYIGRYSKRACLSEYKITAMEGEEINFRYKDYKTKDKDGKPIERILTLHYRDFFPRLLQHVPLPYFRLVRYYGLYSNRVDIPKEYLYKDTVEYTEDDFEETDLTKCKNCNHKKEYLYTYVEKRMTGIIFTYKRLDLEARNAA